MFWNNLWNQQFFPCIPGGPNNRIPLGGWICKSCICWAYKNGQSITSRSCCLIASFPPMSFQYTYFLHLDCWSLYVGNMNGDLSQGWGAYKREGSDQIFIGPRDGDRRAACTEGTILLSDELFHSIYGEYIYLSTDSAPVEKLLDITIYSLIVNDWFILEVCTHISIGVRWQVDQLLFCELMRNWW